MAKIEDELGVVLSDTFVNQKSTVSDLEKQIKLASVWLKRKASQIGPIEKLRFTSDFYCNTYIFTLSRSFQVVEVKGFDLKKFGDEPVIFVANHQSHLDAPDIIKALPRKVRDQNQRRSSQRLYFWQYCYWVFVPRNI
jgi:1-acyl-sn-glycerol-3-phosphate acyltransferase